MEDMKYKLYFLYLFWGIITTLLNIVVYYCLVMLIGMPYLIGNCIAWIIAVTFAYFTNKYCVFNQPKQCDNKGIVEYFMFLMSRLLTGVLDMILMYLLISIMDQNQLCSKIFVNVVVIILNFVFARYFIFKEKD